MLWIAATAIVADNMSYRGDMQTVKQAGRLFPWHRIIQQKAENYGT
jgi:hypothetical protein